MSSTDSQAPFRDTRKFKTELHGVRGLAISLVVAFHVFGQGRVSGGIDVFLAITGFLALPSLTRRAGAGRGGWLINVPQRIAGLSRRLIVPLVPVLLAVGGATWLIAPLARREEIFREVGASALFYENWELINSQLEYGAAGPLASPLQHLWSTSIQGQFHIAMIVFVTVVAFASRRIGRTIRRLLIPALALLTVASFTWAVHETQVNQAQAYFSTFSRAWQLTGPGILGLLVTSIALSPRVRGLMSWIGVALIASCGAVMDGALYFPGPRALWPVLGVCLVLAAGQTRTSWGADRLLVTAPFQRLGDISYSLYLWHWPILIFTMMALGRQNMTPGLAIGVIAVSLVAGRIGYELFEQRTLRTAPLSRRYLPAAIGAASVTAVALAASSLASHSARLIAVESQRARAVTADAAADPLYPGAAVLRGAPQPDPAPIVPEGDWRREDYPWQYADNKEERCIQSSQGVEVLTCETGNADGPLVVIAGGSHIGQWGDSFAELAEDNGWRLVTVQRASCPLTTDARGTRGGEDLGAQCAEWNARALATVLEMDPDLVIAQITTWNTGTDLPELAPEGMIDAVKKLGDAGIDTLLFRETTNTTGAMGDCIDTTDAHLRACSEPREHFFDPSLDDLDARSLGLDHRRAWIFDTSPYLCDEEMCFAELGNVRVHRDEHHLSATLTRTITPYIAEQLASVRPDLFVLAP